VGVGMWVCGCGYVGMWVWVCGYVGVGMWVCGYVGVWCGCGAAIQTPGKNYYSSELLYHLHTIYGNKCQRRGQVVHSRLGKQAMVNNKVVEIQTTANG